MPLSERDALVVEALEGIVRNLAKAEGWQHEDHSCWPGHGCGGSGAARLERFGLSCAAPLQSFIDELEAPAVDLRQWARHSGDCRLFDNTYSIPVIDEATGCMRGLRTPTAEEMLALQGLRVCSCGLDAALGHAATTRSEREMTPTDPRRGDR